MVPVLIGMIVVIGLPSTSPDDLILCHKIMHKAPTAKAEVKTVSRRRDRTPLTRHEIVRAALRVSEDIGVDQVSVHKVGAGLGVTGMSLYHHVADKAELLDLMADAILSEISVPDLDDHDWEQSLTRLAHAFRDGLLRYPRTAPLVLTRRLNAPSALPLVDAALGAIRSAGFGPTEAVQVLRVTIAFLLGTMMREIGMGPGSAEAAPDTDPDGIPPLPHVAECADELATIDHEAELDHGVAFMLRALRAMHVERDTSDDDAGTAN